MRYARLIWSGLGAVVLVVVFVSLPGWDTGVGESESLSGAETFGVAALVVGVAWLVGYSILAALDDSLAVHGHVSSANWLLGLLAKAAFVLGLGFAGLLVGGWLGDATCAESGEPGDFLYGLECMDNALAGAVLGAFTGLAAGVVVVLLAPWRRLRQ